MTHRIALVLAVVFTLAGFAAPTLASSTACDTNSDFDLRTTIEQFIRSADEIAIYNVASVEPLPALGGEPTFSMYRLELLNPIKGDAPSTLDVVGREPYRLPPEHYFGALRRYDQLEPGDPLIFGSSGRGEGPDGACILLPRFVVGYTYVVVSGPIESRASFEPVLDFAENHCLRLIYDAVLSEPDDR